MTSRHFVGLQVTTEREVYELLLGTMRPALVAPDGIAMKFVGRILDIAFLDFEELQRTPPFSKFETAVEPEPGAADDLQLWLLTQFLAGIGHQAAVVEGDLDPVGVVAWQHLLGAPFPGPFFCYKTIIPEAQEHLLAASGR